jgi:hypothetical protein
MCKFSALVALLLILAPTRATPARTPDDCDQFWAAKAVFAGKLIKAYPGTSKSDEYVTGTKRFSNLPVLHLTLSVERAFTGFNRSASIRPVEVECAACLSKSRPRGGERFLV